MNKLLLAIISVSNAIDESSDISSFNLFHKGAGGVTFTLECKESQADCISTSVIALMQSKGFKTQYDPNFDAHTLSINFNFSKK